ncbi:MAG: hypothetical protein K9W45_01100 [Candidatus Heimdallarchaeum aukensis]|uniref:Uncharacterized protein n=1 Tax=Candidatus Heimdallarchaeum aukensis TaxID=2876573 RepID=A0A9Y1BLQ3_9ARCH|nr:MAG: hypothetical protein K9W45_01100 [Candidatus Heimdallarchaeum aukensis]
MIEIVFLNFLNLFVKIWLSALLINILLSTLLKPIYKHLLAIGLVFNLPIKRLFYWIYRVPIENIDWENGLIRTKKVNNMDCLATTVVIMPVFILSYLSSWLFYFAGKIYPYGYKFFGIVLYIVASLSLAFSIPNFEELKLFNNINLHSSLVYLLKWVFVVIVVFSIVEFTSISLDVLTTVILVLLATPFYSYKEDEENVENIKKIIGDPFA